MKRPSPPAIFSPHQRRMSWWSRLLGGSSEAQPKPRVDYLTEAIALERLGDFDAALTSYRLALRDQPNDPDILQNLAIAYTRTGRLEDAIRSYRRALEVSPQLSGAHYGLAFLLLRRRDRAGAMSHLEQFLTRPPQGDEADRWVQHAHLILDKLRNGEDVNAESDA
jgi:Flp pilus assembly protein TadD